MNMLGATGERILVDEKNIILSDKIPNKEYICQLTDRVKRIFELLKEKLPNINTQTQRIILCALDELQSNISKHSIFDELHSANINIEYNLDSIKIIIENFTSYEDLQRLKNLVNIINNSSKEEIIEMYQEQMRKEYIITSKEVKDSGFSQGLGLIKVVRDFIRRFPDIDIKNIFSLKELGMNGHAHIELTAQIPISKTKTETSVATNVN